MKNFKLNFRAVCKKTNKIKEIKNIDFENKTITLIDEFPNFKLASKYFISDIKIDLCSGMEINYWVRIADCNDVSEKPIVVQQELSSYILYENDFIDYTKRFDNPSSNPICSTGLVFYDSYNARFVVDDIIDPIRFYLSDVEINTFLGNYYENSDLRNLYENKKNFFD